MGRLNSGVGMGLKSISMWYVWSGWCSCYTVILCL